MNRQSQTPGPSRQGHTSTAVAAVRNTANGMSFTHPIKVFLLRLNEGNAIVETALALPILLMLLLAIFTFGMAYSNQLALTQAVGAGAQQLQQIRTTTSDPCADTLSAIEAAAPTLTGTIGLTVTMNGTPATGSSCPSAQADLTAGTPVTVTATYPCASYLYGTTLGSHCKLSATVTEYEY